MKCPFCDEDDFDLIGLKNHLIWGCEAYANTISPEQEREERKKSEGLK